MLTESIYVGGKPLGLNPVLLLLKSVLRQRLAEEDRKSYSSTGTMSQSCHRQNRDGLRNLQRPRQHALAINEHLRTIASVSW